MSKNTKDSDLGMTLVDLGVVNPEGFSDSAKDGEIWFSLTEAAIMTSDLLSGFESAVFVRYASDAPNDAIRRLTPKQKKRIGPVAESVWVRNIVGKQGDGMNAPIGVPWFVRVDKKP